MPASEKGYQWWLRYVIVPLMGSGGVLVIIVAALLSRQSINSTDNTSPTPRVSYSPTVAVSTGYPATSQSSTTSRPLPSLASPWPRIGDDQMDPVFDDLNRIERRGTTTETKLALTLGRFFKRSIFRNILEEPLESAAFVFGHAERLLNHYHPFFDQHQAAHEAIGLAKTRLIKLQQTISLACGQDRFFVQTRFSQFATDKAEFENSLLQANGRPLVLDNTAEAEANQTLQQLREALQTAGLTPN